MSIVKKNSRNPILSVCIWMMIELIDLNIDEYLTTQFFENLSYQVQFLPKDRAGEPQNLPEDSSPVKLFQLFFTTNQPAAHIDFKRPWIPSTITEGYRYLGCLVYMGIQPLREQRA